MNKLLESYWLASLHVKGSLTANNLIDLIDMLTNALKGESLVELTAEDALMYYERFQNDSYVSPYLRDADLVKAISDYKEHKQQ